MSFFRFEADMALLPRSVRHATRASDIDSNSPDFLLLLADAPRFGTDLS